MEEPHLRVQTLMYLIYILQKLPLLRFVLFLVLAMASVVFPELYFGIKMI